MRRRAALCLHFALPELGLLPTLPGSPTNTLHRHGFARMFQSERKLRIAFGLLVGLFAGLASAAAQTAILLPNWAQQSPAISPAGRGQAAMTYDAAHQQIVLFGGAGSGSGDNLLGDTWTWNGSTWTQQSPSAGPVARYDAMMAYDAAHQQVVLFGGAANTGEVGDTWVWNGSGWTQASSSGPSARLGSTMAWDPVRQQIVLFGGFSSGAGGDAYLNDTWIWNGSTWTQQSPAHAPSARSQAVMAWDAIGQQMVLFGGSNNGTSLGDTWTWNGTDWTQQAPATSPTARVQAAMAYDSTLSEVVLFGGVDTSGELADTWTWKGGNWTQQQPLNAPSTRTTAMMADFPPQQQVLLFGGVNTSGALGDTWTYQLPGNMGTANVCPSGTAPSPCSQSSTFEFQFTAAATGITPSVVTQGAQNLDFTDLHTGTCDLNGPSHAYSAGDICTVNVQFTPKYPGTRYGAATLLNASGAAVATAYIYGTGVGPQLVFDGGSSTPPTLGGGFKAVPGISVDASGNVYVADAGNNAIKEIPQGCSSSACVITLGGGFSVPRGVAVDGSGNIYIADYANGVVKEMPPGCTSSACVNTIGGVSNYGAWAVAVDKSGTAYAAYGSWITKIPPGCRSSSCTTSLNGFVGLEAVAVDASGNVYVASPYQQSVKEIPAGCTSSSCTVNLGGASSFSQPNGLAVDGAGNLYVANLWYVDQVSPGCTSSSCVSIVASVPSGYSQGVAVDGSGNVYLSQSSPNSVEQVRFAGPLSQSFDSTRVGSESIDSPHSLSLRNIGNAPLSFSVPASGQNPSVSANFELGSGSCPEVLSSSSPGTLPPGSNCEMVVSFNPTTAGQITGAVVITDNNLNVTNAMQSIGLSGTGLAAGITPTVTVTPNATSIAVVQSLQVLVAVSGGAGNPTPGGSITLSSGSFTSAATLDYTGKTTIIIPDGAMALGTDTLTAIYTPNASSSPTYGNGTGQANVTVTWPAADPSTGNLGAVNVGSTSSTPTSIMFNFTATETVGSTAVVTQGALGLDFTNAGTGTCDTNGSSHVYNPGDSCTVNVNFTPKYAGAHYGAVNLLDGSGTLLATSYISAAGVGPQLVFSSTPSVTTLGGGLVSTGQPAVDGSGNVYVADYGSGAVKKIPAGCVSASCVTPIGGGFVDPFSVAVDGGGNVYVSDLANDTVSEVPVGCFNSGCVKALGGGFNDPTDIAVDRHGNIYVNDYSDWIYQGAVKEIPSGCTSASCVTTLAQVTYPEGIAVDGADNVYVVNSNIHQLQVARCASDCLPLGYSPVFAFDVSVDPSGNVYTVPYVFDASGNTYTTANGAVQRQNLATPPSLSFPQTNTGARSYSQNVSLLNIGNAPLTFPVPGSGTNPSISGDFILDASTTCPQVQSSGSAGTLAAGVNCNLAVDFKPTTAGPASGSMVLTDNNLNVANTTQSIALSGTGASPTPLTPWIQVNNGAWQLTNSLTVSPGDTVNLGEQMLTGGSYSWTGPGGYSSSSRIAPSVPLNSTSNVFTLTYTNAAGATSTATFTINVGSTPLTPYIQVNNGGWQPISTVTVSPGSTVNLGEQMLTGGSYSWTGPGGYSSSSRIAPSVPLNSTSNVFTLTYTNSAGATSTATFTVKVGSTPLTPWIQVNNGGWQNLATVTVSPGSTVNLGEQVLTGGSYSWTGPSGYTSTSRIASNVPLNSATNTFTLTYTNSAGATSTATFTVKMGGTPLTPYIQVSNGGWQPIATVTVNPGSTVNLGEQMLTGGSYSWTGPGGYTSTSRIASNVPLNSASNVFTLTYTNTSGATSTVTFTVSVGSTPLTPWIQINNGGWVQASSRTVPLGSHVDLGTQVLTGGSYTWTGPGGFSSTARVVTNVPLTSGINIFTQTYTNTVGASSTETFTITLN